MRSRHSFLFTLTLLSLTIPSVALAAGDELTKVCPFGTTILVDTTVSDEDAEGEAGHGSNEDEIDAQKEEYIEIYRDLLATYEEEIAKSYTKETCGTTNTVTGYIEKGDCSAAGKVITEITEVIAPDVTLEKGAESENKIVTVYSGICCGLQLEGTDGTEKTPLSCEDVFTLYTPDYDSCNATLQSCEKRQWVIGSSGIGLVKLMVKQIFTFGALAVGSIAVSTIVFQGIKISVSGVSGDISESKNKILQAIGGIVLLFLSGLILLAINPEFFGS